MTKATSPRRLPEMYFMLFLPSASRWLSLWLVSALMLCEPVYAQGVGQMPDANLRALRGILEMPEDQIDLAKSKLAIDRMIDPGIDVVSVLSQLDLMASQVRARFPQNALSRQKLELLRTYVYQSVPWNNHQPFRYDLDDPDGKDIRNKLLANYLATRKGNCVSMPLLFVILGQKLGIDLYVSTAPEHLFVKYRDEMGNWHNLEATSGAGFTRDAWIQQQTPMTPQALSNGVYMQALSKRETVAVMAGTLREYYGSKGQEERRIAVSKLTLSYYPKDVQAMVQTSAAYHQLRQRLFVEKFRSPNDIPMELRPQLAQLEKHLDYWWDKAEALGWREPTQESQARYQEAVKREKATRKGDKP